jgi:hypothetical protein
MNRMLPVFCFVPIALTNFVLWGCTSDPYAPINQSTPIRQLDNAFDPSGSRHYERTAQAPYPPGGYDSPSYSRY